MSVLSDFEEFAVYDCRTKPALGEKSSKARLLYLTFRDYIERWDEIAGIFSKEAVLKGSFDHYAREAKGKRGTTAVDDEFLAEIEGWRETLARNIALRNPGIEATDLNFAVQRTIDRIGLPADLRGPRDRAYGTLQAACPTARTSTAAWASCSSGPTSATTRACSISVAKRTAPSPPTS